jgi:hypothetical protein
MISSTEEARKNKWRISGESPIEYKNIFADIPDALQDEVFETLRSSSNGKIESILSQGQHSPDG